MIRIIVMGQTWDIRKRLKDNGFRWNPANKTWNQTVAEASLDKTIDAIRPIKSWSDKPDPEITVILMKVDVGGNPFNLPEVRVRLQSVARPGGESVLDFFNR